MFVTIVVFDTHFEPARSNLEVGFFLSELVMCFDFETEFSHLLVLDGGAVRGNATARRHNTRVLRARCNVPCVAECVVVVS